MNTNLDFVPSKFDVVMHDYRNRDRGVLPKSLRGLNEQVGNDHTKQFSREVFSRLYSDPGPTENPPNGWTTRAQSILTDMPQWEALRASVEGDADFAAWATSKMIDELAPLLGKHDDNHPFSENEMSAMRKAARDACERITGEANQSRSVMNMFGDGFAGRSAGNQTSEDRINERMDIINFLAQNKAFLKIMQDAGRIFRTMDSNATASQQSFDEIVDIEMNNDVSRLIPSELARLAQGGIHELLLLRDLVERKALCYRYDGREKLGRGPVVVLWDKSGSMGGLPLWIAQSIVVACVNVCVAEGRQMAITPFDTKIHHWTHFDGVNRWSKTEMLRRNGSDKSSTVQTKMLDVVRGIVHTSAHGGTDLAKAIQSGIGQVETLGCEDRMDLIIVTDGQDIIPSDVLESIKTRIDEHGMRIHGITLNGGDLSDSLKPLCSSLVDLAVGDDVADAMSNVNWVV